VRIRGLAGSGSICGAGRWICRSIASPDRNRNPTLPDQHGARDDLPGMSHDRTAAALPGWKRHRNVAAHRLAAVRREVQTAPQELWRGQPFDPAGQRLDPGQQFDEGIGLGQIIVASARRPSARSSALPCALSISTGQIVAVRAQLAYQRKAVLPGRRRSRIARS
jgi:hypothetical protein